MTLTALPLPAECVTRTNDLRICIVLGYSISDFPLGYALHSVNYHHSDQG